MGRYMEFKYNIKFITTMKTFLRQNTWLSGICEHGWGNGYVIIPKEHPAYGLDYNDIKVSVHGGLTFAKDIADIHREMPTFLPSRFKSLTEGWVVGFDTAHCGDTLWVWSKGTVRSETNRLKRQLLKYSI